MTSHVAIVVATKRCKDLPPDADYVRWRHSVVVPFYPFIARVEHCVLPEHIAFDPVRRVAGTGAYTVILSERITNKCVFPLFLPK